MKSGDRVLICIGEKQYMCAVVESGSKSELLLVSEDGEQIASIRQFWRKTSHMLGGDSKFVETVKKDRRNSGTIKRCEAPGCNKAYAVKKADLARGWGKTCCKSCAAKLREVNKK